MIRLAGLALELFSQSSAVYLKIEIRPIYPNECTQRSVTWW